MAWTTPMTFVANEVLTATQLNTYLRDNLLETEAAKVTTPGSLLISTGANKIIERIGGSQTIDTAETTTSTTFTDLATIGPKITCTTGSRAFVFITCAMKINVANVTAQMAVEVSGATSIAASDSASVSMDGVPADKENLIGLCNFYETLTPGVNVFTAKYRCLSGNTATLSHRNLTVIPF